MQAKITDNEFQQISALELPYLRKMYLHFLSSTDPHLDHRRLFEAVKSLHVVQLQWTDSTIMSRCWLRRELSTWASVSALEDEWKHYNVPAVWELEAKI